MRLSTEKNLKN